MADKSKGTAFRTWCDKCKIEAKITIEHQRIPEPSHCSFCAAELLVESIRTFKRRL